MELGRADISFFNEDVRDVRILAPAKDRFALFCFRVIRMDEIKEGVFAKAPQQRILPRKADLVPADLGDLISLFRRKAADLWYTSSFQTLPFTKNCPAVISRGRAILFPLFC